MARLPRCGWITACRLDSTVVGVLLPGLVSQCARSRFGVASVGFASRHPLACVPRMCADASTLSIPADTDLKPGDGFRDCPDCPLMAVVPSGVFDMGAERTSLMRDGSRRPRLAQCVASV